MTLILRGLRASTEPGAVHKGEAAHAIYMRAYQYMLRARKNVKAPPQFATPKAMVVQFRHAELCSAVGVQHMAAVKPEPTPVIPRRSLEDF